MANELVLVSSRSDVRDNKHDGQDDLGIELEAMSTIGRTLDAIENPALRQRILNWALERWGGGDSLRKPNADAAAPRAAISPANDPSLSVDSIGDLFGDRAVEPRSSGSTSDDTLVVPQPAAKAPVETMLQSLAADFQRLADEWNGETK
jgi:hypothetical protein